LSTDFVVLGFGLGVGHRHLVVHRLHAGDVAAAQRHLFLDRLGGGRAQHRDLALRAVELHLHVADAQVLRADIGLDGLGGLGIQVLRRLGCLCGAAAEQLFAGFLDETEKSHG